MSTWIVVGLALLVLVAVSVWRGWPVQERGPSRPAVSAEVVALREIAETLRGWAGPVRRRGPDVTIRLMSGSLTRELGRLVVEDRRREPTVVQVVDGAGRSVFVASHQDGAGWVYRRVGVEQEARDAQSRGGLT